MPITYDAKGNPMFTRSGPPPAQGGPQAPAPTQGGLSNGRYNRNANMEMSRLLDLLEKYRNQGAQDLSNINLGVNQEDIDLVQKMEQAALAPGLAQISSAAGARGISGSSIEGVERGRFMVGVEQQGQQFLQNQAFQRAGFELSKNQQLFNSLIGSTQNQFQLTQGTKPQQKQHGWLNRLGRGALGAGFGFATGGPAGAAVGGVAGAAGGGNPSPDMNDPNYGWGAGANPWDFPEYGWGG